MNVPVQNSVGECTQGVQFLVNLLLKLTNQKRSKVTNLMVIKNEKLQMCESKIASKVEMPLTAK